MTKKLIDEVRAAGGELAAPESAKRAVDAVLNSISKLTDAGERVTIRGFGTFQKKRRAARVGRNPKTREEFAVPARDQLTFRDNR
ncbi:MAG: HU family DNA-binding protein [Pseudomonadota bacterium]